MSDKIMEARRAAFERWQWPHLDSAEHLRGMSMYDDAWEVWNAALDSLCVELPENPSAQKGVAGILMGEIAVRAIDACREAIHAAGVKTR